jgi:hypothetical protein
MRTVRLALGSLGAVLAIGLAVAQGGCGSGDAGVTCSPGQPLKCSCGGSLSGQATCDGSGHEGPCDCSGGSGSSSGATGSSTGSSGSGSSTGSSGSSSSSSGGEPEGGAPAEGGQETGAPPGDSGMAVEGGGVTPFGQACVASTDCQSNDCQNFPAKGGNYCTQPCATDAQCPTPPGLGCGGMGYCKVP